MRPGPALQEVPNRGRGLRARFEWSWLLVAAIAIAALAAVTPLTRSGAFVDHVRVTNPSDVQFEVDVTALGDDAWLGLGAARPGETSVFDDVYDQGEVWVFRFWTPDHHVEARYTRAELQRAGWKVAVPEQVARPD
jgi:hypothetical protein